MKHFFEIIGVVTAAILPLFNIPLIIKMVKRKSSEDISLVWAIGVWVCILLMVPSGLMSKDIVFKTFNISNVLFFSVVAITVIKYRKKECEKK